MYQLFIVQNPKKLVTIDLRYQLKHGGGGAFRLFHSPLAFELKNGTHDDKFDDQNLKEFPCGVFFLQVLVREDVK